MKGEFKLGDIVYLAYTPVKCGRVIEVIPGKEYPDWRGKFAPATLVIQMLNGKTLSASELSFHNFRTLVEDHKRKYEKHSATLSKLEAL